MILQSVLTAGSRIDGISMKKATRRNISIIITLIITAVLAFTMLIVFAHPGGTDYRGGHKNHATGDYHYHHGYSAHQHYDMDGDGDRDCPYTFKGNTTSSSSSRSQKSSKSSSKPSSSNNSTGKTTKGNGSNVLWIVVAVIVIPLVVWFFYVKYF